MTSNTTKWVVGIAMSLSLSALTACTSSSADSQKDVAAPEDCTPEHDVTTVEDGVLTVAAVNVPPVVVSSDNDFEGLEPTLIKKFAEANCLSVKANTMDFAATIPAILRRPFPPSSPGGPTSPSVATTAPRSGPRSWPSPTRSGSTRWASLPRAGSLPR